MFWFYSARCFAFIRAHHLSLYATSAVDRYTRKGWLALVVSAFPLSTFVIKPTYGPRLQGGQWLVAGSSLGGTGDDGTTRVDFYVKGETSDKAIVLRATRTFPMGGSPAGIPELFRMGPTLFAVLLTTLWVRALGAPLFWFR